jgi:hypothetical protein
MKFFLSGTFFLSFRLFYGEISGKFVCEMLFAYFDETIFTLQGERSSLSQVIGVTLMNKAL